MTAPSSWGKWGTFVISREKCPTCGGTGVVREARTKEGDDPFYECPECSGGHGYIETEIPLLGALRELGVAFKKDATTAATGQQSDEDDDDECADDEPPIAQTVAALSNAKRYLP